MPVRVSERVKEREKVSDPGHCVMARKQEERARRKKWWGGGWVQD